MLRLKGLLESPKNLFGYLQGASSRRTFNLRIRSLVAPESPLSGSSDMELVENNLESSLG